MTRFPRLLITASLSVGGLAAPAAVHGASDGHGGDAVQSGDSLFGVAHQQGVDVGDLLAANGLTLTSVIHPGQRLAIPAPVANSSSGGGRYTVRSGDSLFGVAHQQGVDVGDLLAANGLTLTSVIHPGQRLAIPAPVANSSSGGGRYTVRSGDSLFGVAHQQGVDVGDLLAANGLTLTSVIHPGQRLAIPAPVANSSSGGGRYTVRSGDSLFGVAHQQGVDVGDLLAANGLTLTSVIHPGQRLAIPAPVANSSSGGGRYTVRSGDSLFGVAHQQGVDVGDLLAANGLTLTSVIHPGQRLEVPAGANSSALASSPSTPLTTATGPTRPSTTPPPTAAPQPIAGPPSTATPTPAGAEVVERIIRDVWPDALEETALAIAWRESGYESGAQSQCCSGLFQIYYDVHKGWLADLGINSRDDLYQPRTNVEAAFALYQRAGGWGPWSLAGV